MNYVSPKQIMDYVNSGDKPKMKRYLIQAYKIEILAVEEIEK